jgi:plasmid stability protein
MHRTQLLLDEWQYEALRARAKRQGKSMSALVREIVAEYLDESRGRSRLRMMEGVAEGPGQAADHDRVIYDEE